MKRMHGFQISLTLSPVSWLATAEHAINAGHTIAFDQSDVLATEDRFWPRKIKEALLIKKHPNFNQDLPSVIFGIRACTSYSSAHPFYKLFQFFR